MQERLGYSCMLTLDSLVHPAARKHVRCTCGAEWGRYIRPDRWSCENASYITFAPDWAPPPDLPVRSDRILSATPGKEAATRSRLTKKQCRYKR